MRGFQYKDNEGAEMFLGKSYVNGSFMLSGGTLTRGFTVYISQFFFLKVIKWLSPLEVMLFHNNITV